MGGPGTEGQMGVEPGVDRIATLDGSMHPAMVGGKFACQKRMIEDGLPIPRFFCLTRKYFDRVFLDVRNEIKTILDGIEFHEWEGARSASREIRSIFQKIKLTDEQADEIFSLSDRMFSRDTLVSVRSSMIGHRHEESEDSRDHAFAGMSESFLYVKREKMLDKIKLCWASGFSQQAILYRQQQGLDLLGFSVAVGIQEMMLGERSFVLFTCDPERASKDTVIVCGYGIGEGVVQEKVSVDHFFRNTRTGEIKARLARKTSQLTFDAEKGDGVVEKPVAERDQEKPCLTDDEIHRLSAVGERIERLFKDPQDIEGTFTSDGKLYLLQSRPVALDYRRQRVWTNVNITESFPGVTTALTYSIARYFYRVIFYDGYRQMGSNRKVLHDKDATLDRMVGFLRGRIYYSLNAFYDLHSQNPLFPVFRTYWEEMMGFHSSYQTKPTGVLRRATEWVVLSIRVAKAALIMVYRYVTHQRGIKKFHAWWDDLISPLRGRSFDDEDPLVMAEVFHRVWREVGGHWGITLTNDTFLPVAYGLAERLFEKWQLDEDPALLSDLLCGDEQVLSVEIVLSSVRLAEEVRSDPTLREAFEKRSATELWKMIEQEDISPSFCRAMKRHLHVHGDRGLHELKMEQPNIRQEPWVLLKTIWEYARSDVTVRGFEEKEKEVRADAERRLKHRMAGCPHRRALLHPLLRILRGLIRNREKARYSRSELFGFSKNIFQTMGCYFAGRGLLPSAEDIVHLSMDEILGYLDGTGVTERLDKLAEVRKGEYRENQKAETPIQITTLGPVRENVLEVAGTRIDNVSVLKGLGSSAGKVTGRARIIRDPTDPPEFTKDMILVARETDPGWLFMMLASKGLVVERGSMLSHTAITGRKFGIPTVVSVPDATSLIPDGARLEMDGASGLITLLEERSWGREGGHDA